MKNETTFNYRYSSSKEQYIIEFMDYVLSKKYGETISLEICGKFLKYNIGDEKELKKFKNLMNRIKNALIDKGYLLKTIPNVGYYIMKPKQIPNYVYRTYTLRTLRLIEKQDRILKHTDISDLNNERKKENEEIKVLTYTTYEAIETAIFQSDYFKNKNIYDELND